MTVNPGFAANPSSRARSKNPPHSPDDPENGRKIHLEVDGGINPAPRAKWLPRVRMCSSPVPPFHRQTRRLRQK